MRILLTVLLIFFELGIPKIAHAGLSCGWVTKTEKYCSQNTVLTQQSGYTVGRNYYANSKITDEDSKLNATNLAPSSIDTFVDKHGICRYLSNLTDVEYFVPFKTDVEWSSYLDTNLPRTLAVSCAPLKHDSLETLCGKAVFDWQIGKQEDRQKSHFEFIRSKEWTLEVLDYQDCNCTTTVDAKGVSTTTCDSCEYCRSVDKTESRSCKVDLDWYATANGVSVGTSQPSKQRAAWVSDPSADLSIKDCDPEQPPAEQKVDGECGYANNVDVSKAPASGLCIHGKPSSVTDNGTSFTWTCEGLSGGASSSCYAKKTDKTIPCGQTLASGGYEGLNIGVQFGSDTGVVTVIYNAYDRPDNYILDWSSVHIETGLRGNQTLYPQSIGPSKGSFTFMKSTAEPAVGNLKVLTYLPSTLWQVSVSCPGKPPAPLVDFTFPTTPSSGDGGGDGGAGDGGAGDGGAGDGGGDGGGGGGGNG